MDIAMFTESYEPSMESKRRQVLVVPHNDEVRIWSRVTDGSKGPHNKWEETTLDNLSGQINAEEILTRTPVGVYVTSADERAIDSKGYSPVLGTKACHAHTKANPTTDKSSVVEVICNFYDQINQGDDMLESYVIDNRATTGSTVPIVVPVPNNG